MRSSAYVGEMGGTVSSQIEGVTHGIADAGGTPLVVAEGNKVLGVIHFKDVVKGGIKERFAALPRHGHSHGDDHRRQSAHRGGDRPRSRRR